MSCIYNVLKSWCVGIIALVVVCHVQNSPENASDGCGAAQQPGTTSSEQLVFRVQRQIQINSWYNLCGGAVMLF